MRDVRITKISIDDGGRLLVFPELGPSESFEFVYRAARGAHWDTAERALYTAAPVTSTYPERFGHIVSAIASEYGCRLQLAAEVGWSNVPDDIRKAILLEHAT